jgi:hypothetical protein
MKYNEIHSVKFTGYPAAFYINSFAVEGDKIKK